MDDILDHNVTPEMINDAQDSTEEEWIGYTFVRAFGVGNPDPWMAKDLTDVVLDVILWMDMGI